VIIFFCVVIKFFLSVTVLIIYVHLEFISELYNHFIMTNMASNIQKVLRYHVPLIRFKYGANQSDSAVRAPKESKSDAKPTGAKTGQKSAPFEFSQIPNKYRRRPLTQDEIDLVTIGGSI